MSKDEATRGTWKRVVEEVIDFLKVFPTVVERDRMKPGVVHVTYAGRTVLVREERLEATISDIRQQWIVDRGLGEAPESVIASVAQALGEPAVEKRRVYANLDLTLRWAMNDYRIMLADAVDATDNSKTTTWPDGKRWRLLGTPGDLLRGHEKKQYKRCLQKIDNLLSALLVTDEVKAETLTALRRAVGRKAGAHDRTNKLGVATQKKTACALKATHPGMNAEGVAKLVGVTASTLRRWPEYKQVRRDQEAEREARLGERRDGLAT